MKKLAALILTMLFVMGLAAYAAAEVSISGDGRVRGVYSNNKDTNDNAQDHERYYDQRVRLNIDGKNDDEAMVKVRITAAEGKLDGGANTKNSALTTTDDGFGNITSVTAGNDALKIDEDDYAYITVPFGDIKVEAGLMPADWGNKFWAWGLSKERIKVYTKMGDTTVGAFTEKVDEAAGGIGTEDYDAYAAYAVAPMGDLKAGVIVVYAKNDGKQDEDTGQKIDAFVNGKMGDMNIAAEVAYNGGDLFSTDKRDANGAKDGKTDDAQMGFFVHADMAMDALNVGGAVAMTQNGYVANKYFTPTALFGTSQPTAVLNFGDGGDATAVVVAVSSKVGDAMTAGVKAAYAQMKAYHGDDTDFTVTEVDGTFTYAIGDNTKYNAVIAYGKPDSDQAGAANDNIIAAMHEITVNF